MGKWVIRDEWFGSAEADIFIEHIDVAQFQNESDEDHKKRCMKVEERIVSCVNALEGYNPEAVREILKIIPVLYHNCSIPGDLNQEARERLAEALANLREE